MYTECPTEIYTLQYPLLLKIKPALIKIIKIDFYMTYKARVIDFLTVHVKYKI